MSTSGKLIIGNELIINAVNALSTAFEHIKLYYANYEICSITPIGNVNRDGKPV